VGVLVGDNDGDNVGDSVRLFVSKHSYRDNDNPVFSPDDTDCKVASLVAYLMLSLSRRDKEIVFKLIGTKL